MSSHQEKAKEILDYLGGQSPPSDSPDSSHSSAPPEHLTASEEAPTEALENADLPLAPLPPPLRMMQIQQLLIAVGLALLSVVSAILLKQVKMLSVLLLGLYFVYLAFMIGYDWRKGKIEEKVVACTRVIVRMKNTQIICRDMNFVYNYFLPDRKSNFIEGCPYIIWTRSSNPKAILSYQPL